MGTFKGFEVAPKQLLSQLRFGLHNRRPRRAGLKEQVLRKPNLSCDNNHLAATSEYPQVSGPVE